MYKFLQLKTVYHYLPKNLGYNFFNAEPWINIKSSIFPSLVNEAFRIFTSKNVHDPKLFQQIYLRFLDHD